MPIRSIKISPTITRRDERSLDHYLREISKYDVLSAEEEHALFMKRSSDPDEVINTIVKHNLRFVVSVAKKYQDCGLPLVSLINEGNLGLLKAAKRFDPTRGFKFISYAVWWIRQSILAALNEKSRKIRTPLNIQSTGNKIKQFRSAFLQHNEREPTMHEIAEGLEMTPSKIQTTIECLQRCSSIDARVSEDDDKTFVSMMVDESMSAPDTELTVKESNQYIVEKLLSKLSPKQAHILRSYYGIGKRYPQSLSAIAEELNLSRERTRQIKDRSVRKLRFADKQLRL